jgi:hypothetical protein
VPTTITLTAKRHLILIQKDGYYDQPDVVTPEPNSELSVVADLEATEYNAALINRDF